MSQRRGLNRPPQSPVMDVIDEYLAQWPAESRGFIIALPAEHNGMMGRARWYTGFDRPASWPGNGVRISAAGADQMHKAKMFEDFQDAWKAANFCAQHWCGGRFTDGIRIVEVTRQPPLIVHSTRPAGVLDALAEL